MSTDKYDVIVIGAGHNGLVCAAYLARAGCSVLTLEAAKRVGGAAVTRVFAPGYSVSAGAHLIHGLAPQVISDLKLAAHGLSWATRNLDTIALAADGNHLTLGARAVTGAGLSDSDRNAYPPFMEKYRRFAGILQQTLTRRPPRLAGHSLRDMADLARLGIKTRLLGRDMMRELLRTGAINIHDVLQENFANELLKGALGMDAVLGSDLAPRSPGTVLTWLYRLAGCREKNGSGVSAPAGGVGAVTQALYAAAQAAGAEVRLGARVCRILLEGDRVSGVETAGGERVHGNIVVSNADPKTTFLQLVGAPRLETGFVRRVNNIRMQGKAAKLHLALDGLPAFAGLEGAQAGQRLLLAPELNYIEHAFDQSKYGDNPTCPVMEITVPTVHDPDLAPPGKHVLSAILQYVPYRLRSGWDDAARETLKQGALACLEAHAPGISRQVVAWELLAPPDLEREFLIHGGHWHHGEYSLDQFMMLRPVPGAAQYATPINGLYLCGAGSHPGGGVLGLPGRNAAIEITGRLAR